MTHECFVSQRSNNDCAVACLTMILKLHNIDITYEEVLGKLKVSREGTSMYDIIKVAKFYNLDAVGYKNYNINNKNYPFMLLTINNNLQHFIVVLNKDKENTYILDPYYGYKVLDNKEFNKIYTGIVIIFNELSFSYKLLFKNKWLIANITFLILLLSLVSIFYSHILSYVIENNVGMKILILFLIISITKELLNYIKNMKLLSFKIKNDSLITTLTFNRILLLPQRYYQSFGVGEIISKINDLSYVKEMFFAISEVLFVNVILIIFCLISLSLISFYLLLINLFILLLLILLNIYYYNKNIYSNYDLQIANENLSKNISDSLNNIIAIHNLNKQSFFIKKIHESYKWFLNIYKTLSNRYINKDLLIKILSFILIFTSIIYMRNMHINNILFTIYIESIFLDSMYALSSLESVFSNYKGTYQRITSLYNKKIDYNIGNKININSISFDNVTITKGDMLYVSGLTGSGKTTFFKKLLDGSNVFLINDKNISKYDIRKSITYVDQNTKLFNLSIKDNILLGDFLKIKEGTYKLISKYLFNNKNENYIINNQSNNISGGEEKMILIMQALNIDSEVIIFDETTSELDSIIERKILNQIKKDYKDRIFIIISHRKDNIDLFDKKLDFDIYKKQRRN